MALVPSTHDGIIRFYRSKIAPWSDAAPQIGTTEEAVSALSDLADAAREKLLAQVAAQQKAINATAELNAAIDKLAAAGSDVIKQIRTQAAINGDDVYLLAQIPAPANPSRIPPPGKPSEFKVTLNPDGSLKLKWKCRNPAGAQGTIYQVSRAVGEGSAFAVIGGGGAKSFIDKTVPAGAARVTYQVVAIRSTAVGEEARFTVNFGVTDGDTASMRQAA